MVHELRKSLSALTAIATFVLAACASNDQGAAQDLAGENAGLAQQSLQPDVLQRLQQQYQCDGGAALSASYLGTHNQQGHQVVVEFDGQSIPMQPVPSASGSHYLSEDGMGGYRWSVNRTVGLLSLRADLRQAVEVDVLTNCQAVGANLVEQVLN